MSKIAGIIHPSAYQKNKLISLMGSSKSNDKNQNTFYNFKNLEIAAWDTFIYTNEKKNLWIMIHGEIENVQDLQFELRKIGCICDSKDPHKLILLGYEISGNEFLKKIKGNFAFALFDEKQESLTLMRDCIGKKSLYWSNQNGYFLFSNDVKSLLGPGVIPQTYAVDGLASYLNFGYLPQDLTPFKGIYKLLPGYQLTVDLKKQLTIHQYWSLSDLLKNKQNESIDYILGKFDQIINLQTQKEDARDVFLTFDPGTLILSTFLSKSTSSHAFSAHFEGNSQTEFRYYRQIADQHFTSYQDKNIYPLETLNYLITAIWHFGEPVADPFFMQLWYLAKIASHSGCKNILSSIGWEELLITSSRYFSRFHSSSSLINFIDKIIPSSIQKKALFPFLNATNPEYKYKILRHLSVNHELLEYVTSRSFLTEKDRKSISPFLYPYFNSEVFTQRFHKIYTLQGTYDPYVYFDMKTLIPDYKLFTLDKSCSFFELNSSVPFLDQNLIELFAQFPVQDFIKNEQSQLFSKIFENRTQGKKYSPQSFQKSRHEFINLWCKDPKCRSIFQLLKNGLLVQENIISGSWIKRQLGYPNLIPSTFSKLWAILTLEIWFRLFINSPVTNEMPNVSLKEFLH